LLYVLRHTDTLELFVRFCTSQHNEENVLFWIAVRDFKALPAFDSAGLQTQAASIVNKVSIDFEALTLFLPRCSVSFPRFYWYLYRKRGVWLPILLSVHRKRLRQGNQPQ
jgi:Regulator of G protein signaling domain